MLALEADTGRELWRANVGAKISAGVGSDGRFAAVVTRDGELVALEAGQVTWSKPLGVRVATAPLVAGERVFVLGVDRTVQAFDALDGASSGRCSARAIALTLSQAGVLAAFKDTLVVGQGPRMAGIDPLAARCAGRCRSARRAAPTRSSASPIWSARRCASATWSARARSRPRSAASMPQRGQIAVDASVGGTDAVAGDGELLFGADASDRITAWRTATGDVAWTSEALHVPRPRRAGGDRPARSSSATPKARCTGSRATRARRRLRLPTDGSAIAVPPVSVGGVLVVVTRSGGVFAFRPPERARR